MDEKIKLLGEFGLNESDLDFKLEDVDLESLRKTLTERYERNDDHTDTDHDEAEQAKTEDHSGSEEQAPQEESFALEGQFRDEIRSAIEQGSEKVETCWGIDRRYYLWDYDHDAAEVYVEDITDWNIYAFPFSMDGDHILIDFAKKKRMKIALVPFDEGGQENPMSVLFSNLSDRYTANDKQWAEKYQAVNEQVSAMEKELAELRKFKADADEETERSKRDEVFAQFDDLSGVDAFEALKSDSSSCSVESLEEKCFAIRGRMAGTVKFAHEQKAPKLPVEKTPHGKDNEPYGGVFAEYGFAPAENK